MDPSQKNRTSRAKNLGLAKSKMSISFEARQVFTKLKQIFVEAVILNYFDLERHIQIETNIYSYAISVILS